MSMQNVYLFGCSSTSFVYSFFQKICFNKSKDDHDYSTVVKMNFNILDRIRIIERYLILFLVSINSVFKNVSWMCLWIGEYRIVDYSIRKSRNKKYNCIASIILLCSLSEVNLEYFGYWCTHKSEIIMCCILRRSCNRNHQRIIEWLRGKKVILEEILLEVGDYSEWRRWYCLLELLKIPNLIRQVENHLNGETQLLHSIFTAQNPKRLSYWIREKY